MNEELDSINLNQILPTVSAGCEQVFIFGEGPDDKRVDSVFARLFTTKQSINAT